MATGRSKEVADRQVSPLRRWLTGLGPSGPLPLRAAKVKSLFTSDGDTEGDLDTLLTRRVAEGSCLGQFGGVRERDDVC